MATHPYVTKFSKLGESMRSKRGNPTHVPPLVIDLKSLTVQPASFVNTGKESFKNIKSGRVVRGAAYSWLITDSMHCSAAALPKNSGGVGFFMTPEDVTYVIKKTLESLQEVYSQSAGSIAEPELLRIVAATLADKAAEEYPPASVEEEWQKLVERGLQFKTNLLRSKDFKSTAEASALIGVGEPAIRRRIRETKTLFALRNPEGDLRIPIWALDKAIAGTVTQSILREAGTADSWDIYHFLTTPHGSLNGLRPFELLLSLENLGIAQRRARDELCAYLRLQTPQELSNVVLQALKADLNENQQA